MSTSGIWGGHKLSGHSMRLEGDTRGAKVSGAPLCHRGWPRPGDTLGVLGDWTGQAPSGTGWTCAHPSALCVPLGPPRGKGQAGATPEKKRPRRAEEAGRPTGLRCGSACGAGEGEGRPAGSGERVSRSRGPRRSGRAAGSARARASVRLQERARPGTPVAGLWLGVQASGWMWKWGRPAAAGPPSPALLPGPGGVSKTGKGMVQGAGLLGFKSWPGS